MDLPQLSSNGPSRPLNMSIKWVQFDTDSSTHGLSWTHVMAHAAGLRCLRWIWMLPSFLAAKKSPLSRWDVVLFSPAQVGGGWCSKHHSATQNTVLQTLATFENGGPAKPVESVEMNLNRTGTWTDKKSPIDFVVRWGCVAQTYQNLVYKDPQARKPKPFFRQTWMMDEVEICSHGFVDLRHLGCGRGLRHSDWLQTISAPISPVRLLAVSSKTPVKYSQHSSALMGITGNIRVKAIPTTCLRKPAALQSLLSLDSSVLTAVIVFISFSLGNSSSPPLTLRGTLLQKPCSKLLGPSVPRQWIVKPEVCLRSSKRSKTSNDIYHCIVFHLILILLLLPSSVAGLTLSIEFIFVRPSDDAVCIGKARGWACKNAWRVCSSRRFGTFATNEAGHVSGEFDGVRLTWDLFSRRMLSRKL